jgi:hypothetical protein
MLHIRNKMFTNGNTMASQKHGIVVCLPTTPRPTCPDDNSPLTLLNADFKLLARITANRIRPLINDLIHPSQHCGVQEINILGAISAVRDTIPHAELTNTPA